MPTKRMVPQTASDVTRTEFKDGWRTIPEWQADCTSEKLVKTLAGGLTVKELNYQDWLEQVVGPMQVRRQFATAVEGQIRQHLNR